MPYLAGLTMAEPMCFHNSCSECVSYSLVAEANTKNGYVRQARDDGRARAKVASVRWGSRPRGYYDAVRSDLSSVCSCDIVVSPDDYLVGEAADLLCKVVDEAVVVVYD